jgi:molybdenum cofactor biosynthesis enzyme MoaA
MAPWASVNLYTNGEIVPCRHWHTSKHHHKLNRDHDARETEELMFFYDFDKYINSKHIVDTRKNQYNGVFVDSCNRCWEDERAGKTSLRQVYNKTFAKHFDFSLINKETFKTTDAAIISMDLKMGNHCNLKCAMCRPELSSSVAQELYDHKDKFKFNKLTSVNINTFVNSEKKLSKFDKDSKVSYRWQKTEEFQQFFNRFKNQLRWISLTGGDPAIQPATIDLLKLITKPDLTIISITTNGTSADDKLINVLKKFKEVWVNISLEAVGEQNNQIRFPSIWNSIEHNITTYSQLSQTYMYVSHVLQSFSAINLVELIGWCDQRNFKMDILELSEPSFLVLNSVPPLIMENFHAELKKISSTLNQHVIDAALHWVSKYKYDTHLHQQRIQYLQTLDSLRGTELAKNYE